MEDEIQISISRSRDWLASLGESTSYALYRQGVPSLLPTCFYVLANECVGRLPQLPPSQIDGISHCIQSCQSADTGLFSDIEIRPQDCKVARPLYIAMQHTYFSLQALNALGQDSEYRVQLADEFVSLEYLRGWVDAGPWQDPWLHSNNIMFALAFLHHSWCVTGDDKYLQSIDFILDYLDERQDPVSGLWHPENGRNDRNAVYAAYHWFPFYFWRNRAPRFIPQIVDTTLGIQLADGYFLPGGGACEDLDAVHTLVMMGLLSDHRASDVRASLLNCARAIIKDQHPDGGFQNFKPSGESALKRVIRATQADQLLLRRNLVQRNWSYSSWTKLTCPIDASDLWSGWFKPLTLGLIQEHLMEGSADDSRIVTRKNPGLGWHDRHAIQKSVPALVNR